MKVVGKRGISVTQKIIPVYQITFLWALFLPSDGVRGKSLLPSACALMTFVADPLQPVAQSKAAQAGLWLHTWRTALLLCFTVYFA